MNPSHPSLILLLTLCVISGLLHPGSAAPAGQSPDILYSTDFSAESDWSTNSNDRFFPDNGTGRYHYLIEGGTGSSASVPLPSTVSGPFILEFDVIPVRTDEGSTFRFGIGTEKRDSQRGPLLMAELANKKGGRLFYLKTVSRENVLNLVGSSPSAGSIGSTVRFEDEHQYHVRLTYYAADNRASITVQEHGLPGTLFTTIAPISGRMGDLTHLFLTSLGDGVPGPQAEGYIDNVTLTIPRTQAAVNPTPEPAPGPEEIPPMVTPVTPTENADQEDTGAGEAQVTPPRTKPSFPSPPTRTPAPKSGGSPLLLLAALGGVLLLTQGRR